MVETIVITKRIGYYNKYALILPDHAAGKRGRYTVYVISASPAQRIRVIGREVTLGHAKRLAKSYQKVLDKQTKK